MTAENFLKLSHLSASLWYWTVVLFIFLPHITQELGPLWTIPAVFAALAVLLVLYYMDGLIIDKTRSSSIYLTAGVITFITGVAAQNLLVEVSLVTMGAVLLSVALAVLSNFTSRHTWPRLRTLSIGVMITSVGLLVVVELLTGSPLGVR